MLEQQRLSKYYQYYLKETLAKTQAKFHLVAIEKLANQLRSEQGSLQLNHYKDHFQGMLENVLVEYVIEEEGYQITLGDFLKYYLNRSERGQLKSVASIQNELEYMLVEPLYKQAKEIGLLNSPAYFEAKEALYLDSLLTAFFEQDPILKISSPTFEQLETFYQHKKGYFQGPKQATISWFSFDSYANAEQGLFKIGSALVGQHNSKKEFANPSELTDLLSKTPGLKRHKFHDAISLIEQKPQQEKVKSSGTLPIQMLRQVSTMQPGTISQPVKVSGSYIIIYMHQHHGRQTLPLIYIQDQLEKLWLQEQEKQVIEKLLSDLRQRYTIEKNLPKEYKEYL